MSEYDEAYLEQQRQIAMEMTRAVRNAHLQRSFLNLRPCRILDYLNSIKKMPSKPVLKWYQKNAKQNEGITLGKRIKAFFSDDEDKDLQIKKETAEAEAKKRYEIALQEYYRQVETENKRLRTVDDALLAHEKKATEEYFAFCLYQDSIPNNGLEDFDFCFRDLSYSNNNKTLSLFYRLPDNGDVALVNKYEFSEEHNHIIYTPLEDEYATLYYKNELQALMFRAASVLFLSDEYKSIDLIEIVGFFDYYDPSYGTNQLKNVMQVKISAAEFAKVDITKVEIDRFLSSHAQVSVSAGLYEMKAYEVETLNL